MVDYAQLVFLFFMIMFYTTAYRGQTQADVQW